MEAEAKGRRSAVEMDGSQWRGEVASCFFRALEMSATTQTLIAASTPRADITQSQSVKDVAQAALDSPQLLALLTAVIGPIVRQPGNSDLFGALSGLVIWLGAHYGLTVPPAVAVSLCVAGFVVFARVWQYASIWLGKRNAPVQPTPPPGGVL